jgi:GAF domain-containing protein
MLDAMSLRATTVRFSDDLWHLLEREAEAQGVSVAQLIRDAAILRVAALAERRGDRQSLLSVEELAARGERRRTLGDGQGGGPAAEALASPTRMRALRRTGLLDTGADEAFDRLTDVARRSLNAPVALITLVSQDRQFFKSAPGLKEPWQSRRETPLSYSFCAYVATSKKPMAVSDSRLEPDLGSSPAVEELGVIAYLGVPLLTQDGEAIGALCVIDHKSRTWTSDQQELLETLAGAVMDRIEARRSGRLPKPA